jgi:putative holliday junction resolvase
MPDPRQRGVRLGVDVGSVRVGVARSDPDGILATPVATVARTSDAEPAAGDSDIERIAELVQEHAAVGVVVGLPRSLSGGEGPAAARARKYAAVVAARIAPVWVRLVDERLTSVDAHRTLRESGVAGRRQRAVVDQAAAVLILQTALDTERSTGAPPGEQVGPGRRKPRTKDARP